MIFRDMTSMIFGLLRGTWCRPSGTARVICLPSAEALGLIVPSSGLGLGLPHAVPPKSRRGLTSMIFGLLPGPGVVPPGLARATCLPNAEALGLVVSSSGLGRCVPTLRHPKAGGAKKPWSLLENQM